MKDRVFFIDSEGKVIENEEYESHIGLATFIINNNEKLKKEFEDSGYTRQDLFLIEYVGYTLGYRTQYEGRLIINKEKTTPIQKKTAFKFVQSGYKFEFTDDEKVQTRLK